MLRKVVLRAGAYRPGDSVLAAGASWLRGRGIRHPSGFIEAEVPEVGVNEVAAPIIAALGMTLPGCEVTIDTLSLVIQHGPPLSWDWQPIGTAHLAAPREVSFTSGSPAASFSATA